MIIGNVFVIKVLEIELESHVEMWGSCRQKVSYFDIGESQVGM